MSNKAEMVALTTKHARDVGIPPALALALVEQESGFNPAAYRAEPGYYRRYIAPNPSRWRASPIFGNDQLWGSHGLTQVLSSTGYGQGYPLTLDPRKGGTADGRAWPSMFDPDLSLEIGLRYFVGLLLKHGTFAAALSAYNAGSPTSTQGAKYAKSVLARAAKYLRAGVIV